MIPYVPTIYNIFTIDVIYYVYYIVQCLPIIPRSEKDRSWVVSTTMTNPFEFSFKIPLWMAKP